MKKLSAFFILLALTAILAVPAFSLNVGDRIGNVLYTDIVAKIDGHPIPAYNVNGYMAVVAEDLRDYGFNVIWDADSRTVLITSQGSPNPDTFPKYVPEPPKGKIGQPAFPVLHTDIVTYVDSRYVESFNIDGHMVIYFRDLRRTGNVEYDNDLRTSFYTRGGEPWSISKSMTSFGGGNARAATGTGLTAEVLRTRDGTLLNILSDPGGSYELQITQKNLRIATYSVPEGDPYFETAFYRAFHELWSMGLPDSMDNYLRYDNSPEQRDAVSSHLLVTLNGEVVKGDAWFGYGNGHTDLYFDFDRFVTLGVGDVLRIEVGEEVVLPGGEMKFQTPREQLEAFRQRFLFYEEETVENALCYVLRGEFRGTPGGNTHDVQIIYKNGSTKNLTASVYPYFQVVDHMDFGADPTHLIVTGKILSADRENLVDSTIEVDIYTGAVSVR